MRVKTDDNIFRETHVKIFNTGKLEIPGIRSTKYLKKVLGNLMIILNKYNAENISYNDSSIKTVLINSNFTFNYFINRDKFADILKYKYNIHVAYDPCSYPGIQCKFYYNEKKNQNDGVCNCEKRCEKKIKKNNSCSEISFMIFRTGSILIVGNCNEQILKYIYQFIKKILIKEASNIAITGFQKKKVNKKKIWKRVITVTNK